MLREITSEDTGHTFTIRVILFSVRMSAVTLRQMLQKIIFSPQLHSVMKAKRKRADKLERKWCVLEDNNEDENKWFKELSEKHGHES